VVTEKECLSPFTKQSSEGFYSHTHVNVREYWERLLKIFFLQPQFALDLL